VKITLLPRNRTGKWSAGLSVFFIILIGLKIQPAGIPLPTFFIAILGLAGFFAGIAAIIKDKDRAILTFLSILVGLIIIIWFAAELIFPH
jgi:hypothetical protein